MWTQALQTIQDELQSRPDDAIAWYNLGRILWELQQPEQAVAAFDQARALGLPWRMFWYQFDAFDAYLAVDRPGDVLALTQATIDSGGGGEEVYYWLGLAYEALGDRAAAQSAWQYALWWHPNFKPSLEKLGS
jgi:tetratricopeptide (TPR) repeat protein